VGLKGFQLELLESLVGLKEFRLELLELLESQVGLLVLLVSLLV
jgi:hypothetical protein